MGRGCQTVEPRVPKGTIFHSKADLKRKIETPNEIKAVLKLASQTDRNYYNVISGSFLYEDKTISRT